MRVFVINPGATSTKIAIFDEEVEVFSRKILHTFQQFSKFPSVIDQLALRIAYIEDALKESGNHPLKIDCVIGRGGLLKSLEAGTYKIDRAVIEDMSGAVYGEHASNLGTIIANYFAEQTGTAAYFCDPVSVNGLTEIARISGYKGIERRSLFHALNQRAAAKQAAKQLDKPYDQVNLIVAHLGGGVSVAAHQMGKVIDLFNVKDEGSFAMDRTGGLPLEKVVEVALQHKYEIKRVKNAFHKTGGVVSYLGTSDLIEVEQMIDSGNEEALLIFNALAYQLAKDMGAMYSVLRGRADALVITGGMANSRRLVDEIKGYMTYIPTVIVLPGEFEMEAMAQNALAAHKAGNAKTY